MAAMSTLMEQIQQLPLEERLRMVAQIWDGIKPFETPLLVIPWQAEAERRLAELVADPTASLTREADAWYVSTRGNAIFQNRD
jgi:putative addiction module component (TIGR02574 family)